MSTQDIVQKLWNLCNILRDDGITYHQYVTELTYILFLKMINENGTEERLVKAVQADVQKRLNDKDGKGGYGLSHKEQEEIIGALGKYSWKYLTSLDGLELKNYYYQLLSELGSAPLQEISQIYVKAVSSIDEPRNLKKIITEIDKLDWYDAKAEGLGDLYEGLLQKNADEKKSGAGQYFTPRVLIDVMTELIDPQLGEKCFDPACGTFGFMIAAYRNATEGANLYSYSDSEYAQKIENAFGGVELVPDAHRLALMNAYLHNVPANIECMDSLSSNAKKFREFDVVLTNPPFGTKKGGERPTRDDISFQTSNKQLNFLQVIYRSLKADGKARCAVVMPDNVLFAGGDGTSVRRELMNFCDLHTILRLPT